MSNLQLGGGGVIGAFTGSARAHARGNVVLDGGDTSIPRNRFFMTAPSAIKTRGHSTTGGRSLLLIQQQRAESLAKPPLKRTAILFMSRLSCPLLNCHPIDPIHKTPIGTVPVGRRRLLSAKRRVRPCSLTEKFGLACHSQECTPRRHSHSIRPAAYHRHAGCGGRHAQHTREMHPPPLPAPFGGNDQSGCHRFQTVLATDRGAAQRRAQRLMDSSCSTTRVTAFRIPFWAGHTNANARGGRASGTTLHTVSLHLVVLPHASRVGHWCGQLSLRRRAFWRHRRTIHRIPRHDVTPSATTPPSAKSLSRTVTPRRGSARTITPRALNTVVGTF